MDINNKFNSFILKYGIDRCHPRFSASVKAENLILQLAEEYSSCDWVLITENQTDSRFFCSVAGNAKIRKIIEYGDLTRDCLNSLKKWQSECLILIISFYNRYKIKNMMQNFEITALCIYDYFACNELYITGNYYDVFGESYFDLNSAGNEGVLDYAHLDINSIFFYDRRCYESTEIKAYQELYLARMIFDCAYARDLEKMKQYIQEYVRREYKEFNQYKEFLIDVEALLQEISKKLSERRQKDIVMFWIDALGYEKGTDMPWLSSIAECGLEFERAYTVTPYTHSTARALFTGKYIVDDKAFNVKIDNNCSLINTLRAKGYKVLFYTGLKQVEDYLKGKLVQNGYTPLSQTCWYFLCELLDCEEPVFAVLHELFQTHFPFVSMGITGMEYICSDSFVQGDEKRISAAQIEDSRRYTDQVLRYYSNLLSDQTFKIYMSDHGNSYFTYLDCYHTTFRVLQKDIKPQKIRSIFSYISFGHFIEKLIEEDDHYEDICSEFAVIQDTDYYNKTTLEYIMKHCPYESMYYFGYEGIITDSICFRRYNDGREEYFALQKGGPVTEELVQQARNLCPQYPDNIILDDKFKYSKNIYASLNRYMARNKIFEEKKHNTILHIIEQIPESAIIAVRGGGMHTYQLWLMLPWQFKKRICFVIDQNPNCMAVQIGMTIIDLSQIQEKGVSHVLISSFEHEGRWKQELETAGCKVEIIGLYEGLENRGVKCKNAFYFKEYAEEDIVWKG